MTTKDADAKTDNGWGFTREDLKTYGVTLAVVVQVEWNENTPPEMRKVFGEMSGVCEHIAKNAVHAQLRFDGLMPADKQRQITTGRTRTQAEEIIRDTGWRNA